MGLDETKTHRCQYQEEQERASLQRRFDDTREPGVNLIQEDR